MNNIFISSYLLVRYVNGVPLHGRVLYGLTDAIHSFGNVPLPGLELWILGVLNTITVHIIVRHLPLLLFRHLALDSHHDHHIVADALIILRKSCRDGHLIVSLLLSGVDLQGIRFDDWVVFLSVYANLQVEAEKCTSHNINFIELLIYL